MATYVPSSSGQQDSYGNTYYLRLKVDRVYNSATNKSTLTITPQFKGINSGVVHGVTSGTLSVNGSTLMSISSGSPYGFADNGNWADLKNVNNSNVYSVTCELNHNTSGVATARFVASFRTADAGGTVSNEFSIDDTETYTETVSGTVQIYAGTNWVECEPYVYDGSNWVKCEPYIYTSNGWVKY